MPECQSCHSKFKEYITMQNHRCYTVKEWKKLCNTVNDGSVMGNDLQFYNHETGRLESYDHISVAEVILSRHQVFLRDYKTKKEKLFNVLDKFNMKNLDKGITKFNGAVDSFSRAFAEPKKKQVRKKSKKRKPKKQKEPDYSFLNIGKNRKTDYSFILPKKKTSFF